ncbi:c-type cytochrome [Pelagicoccus sp. NFK12]|uniref:C-type cytochrome n=1 Tax=Pelagicoccus enzymogenes TaxID=2773457 RepID=A0A927F6M4_9BACT|nr:c-type cytochrome [Pelagicoccus enzymogenes]MBD5778960.1 c-type cytochrome [Pelagicoccus enzymogenes]
MKRIILRAFAGILLLAILFVGFIAFRFNALATQNYLSPQFTIAADVSSADIALGHRIYAVRAGCIDCHGEDASGVLIMENGPMGKIHGANLTPYNLKDWSDEEIATAIRYGIHKSGRSLRFMPSFDYTAMSKGDIAALVAYLRTLDSVEKPLQENSYGPIARMLSSFGKMPVMFPAAIIDPAAGFAEKPKEGPTAEFGRYLASSCVGCHGEDMAGGPIPGGDPSWPEAGNSRLGSNPIWTKESFAHMISTGISPTTGQAIRAPMPVALLKQFNEDEVTALWEYLKTLD